MLKANSKQARKNIFEYVKGYTEERIKAETPKELYREMYQIFRSEKGCPYNDRLPEYEVFEDWASGLALTGLFCFWYNRPAVDDIKAILEETEEEAGRFTEDEAERFLTRLIYNEMKRNL